jgi:hypothetical protein
MVRPERAEIHGPSMASEIAWAIGEPVTVSPGRVTEANIHNLSAGRANFGLPTARENHLAVCNERQDRVATSDFQPCVRYCTAATLPGMK